MPEDTDTKHQISGIDKIQACIGNDGKNSVSVCLGVIRTLVKMISTKVERVIYFDGFFSNNVSIFNNLDVTYIIADGFVISQQEFIFGVAVAWKTLKGVLGSYGTVGVFNPDLKGWIVTRLRVVDNGFTVAVD